MNDWKIKCVFLSKCIHRGMWKEEKEIMWARARERTLTGRQKFRTINLCNGLSIEPHFHVCLKYRNRCMLTFRWHSWTATLPLNRGIGVWFIVCLVFFSYFIHIQFSWIARTRSRTHMCVSYKDHWDRAFNPCCSDTELHYSNRCICCHLSCQCIGLFWIDKEWEKNPVLLYFIFNTWSNVIFFGDLSLNSVWWMWNIQETYMRNEKWTIESERSWEKNRNITESHTETHRHTNTCDRLLVSWFRSVVRMELKMCTHDQSKENDNDIYTLI